MFDVNRYPHLNDKAHDRPILSTARNWVADWVWVLAPVAVIGLAFFIR